MSKSPCACVVPGIANPPSGKVALGELWPKAWIAIAQNRLPFGFHIHIIDLWIFYTVFTTPPYRLYLHFWSTFQSTLHKHNRLDYLMKFQFEQHLFALCWCFQAACFLCPAIGKAKIIGVNLTDSSSTCWWQFISQSLCILEIFFR